MGGLLWTGIGVLLLLHNFSLGPSFWSMIGRYWPILLILLGLGKVIDYFRHKEGVSLHLGEVFGIFFLLIIGTVITRVESSNFGHVLREMPIRIGDVSVRPGQWIGRSFSYNKEASYPVVPSAPLRVENAYGSISVLPGTEGEIRVRLRTVVFNDDEEKAKRIADEIRLEGGTEGQVEAEAKVKPEAEPVVRNKAANKVFVLRTNRDELSSKDYRYNTELEVTVPRKSQVTVRNSYGEVRVSGIEGKLDLSTSHNPIEVRDCSGDVTVANRFAESRIFNLTGNLSVDARGRVYAETIKGDVGVRTEYSPVEIRDVTGKVTVSNTDSSITVDKVAKAVVIDGQGCQVTAQNISDALKIAASHKRVNVSQIDSNITLETRYSTIQVKGVKGNLDITSDSDRLTLDSITGYVKVRGEGTGVHADGITGPVEIVTNRKDVTVNNFENACKVSNEYGDVTLSTGTVGKGELSVKNRNGSIDLFLPENAAFQIDATARNGRIDSEYHGLESVQGANDVGLLKGKMKNGGPKIVLETEYSNIHIRTREGENAPSPEAEPKRPRRARQTT
jgi:hypothetical protein